MSTDIVPFTYADHEVRTVEIDGQPWFVAVDVCAVLDIADARQAAQQLDEDDRSMTTVIDRLGWAVETV